MSKKKKKSRSMSKKKKKKKKKKKSFPLLTNIHFLSYTPGSDGKMYKSSRIMVASG